MTSTVLRRHRDLRNQIDTTRLPRMATHQTTQRQPTPMPNTEFLQSLRRIFRATRIKPAITSQPWTHQEAITPEQAQQYL